MDLEKGEPRVKFYFKIPVGYKNVTNCLIGALFVAFLRGGPRGLLPKCNALQCL